MLMCNICHMLYKQIQTSEPLVTPVETPSQAPLLPRSSHRKPKPPTKLVASSHAMTVLFVYKLQAKLPLPNFTSRLKQTDRIRRWSESNRWLLMLFSFSCLCLVCRLIVLSRLWRSCASKSGYTLPGWLSPMIWKVLSAGKENESKVTLTQTALALWCCWEAI